MASENRTRITSLVTRGDDTLVTISGIDGQFRIASTAAYDLQLVSGVTLTPSQVDLLRDHSAQHNCVQTALKLLAMRDYSIGELRAKLSQRGHQADPIAKTMADLIKRGYLDDEKYAMAYARRVLRERPCGQPRLIAHLMKKMIPRAIAELTAAAVSQTASESTLAVEALRRRWRQFQQFELEVAQRKAYTYLSGRGFSYAAAKAAFDTLNRKKDEDSD